MEEPVVVDITKKQNGRMSVPGSVLIKTTLVVHLNMFLSKQIWTIGACGQNNAQAMIEYTSGKVYGNLVLQTILPGAKRL